MGYLEIIIGPMFSGKTSLLIQKYLNKFMISSDNKIAINYYKDSRYGNNVISTHDGKQIPCIFLNSFKDENLEFKQKYIFINEAQFFENLKNWVIKQVETNNKHLILCGLDSDYKREKFGEILDLIPFANKVTKLEGNCRNCKNPSLFTHRITKEKEQEVIGVNNYIPVCRECFINFNN